jgi:diphosphoinositol-polyphosphate diphosphatase
MVVTNEAETEVLLVSSSRRPETWIIPGGGVEPTANGGTEEASVTAMRECLEEAGVQGKIMRCLGIFEVRDFISILPNSIFFIFFIFFYRI